MKKILIISCCFLFCVFSFIQTYASVFSFSSEKENSTSVLEDSVVIVGGWRSKYLEDPVYIKNKEYVIFQYDSIRKIIDPDIETFRVVKNVDRSGIAVDKNGVYFQGIFIKTDTAGIKVVGRNNTPNTQWLWKTKNKVFKNEIELPDIDAESFQPVGCFNGAYFKDKNFVYYFDTKIEGSDGSSVSESCSEICYDANQVYINGEIAFYEGEKLKPINDVLAKTNTQVIVISNKRAMPDIDAPSLKKLSRKYSMDKEHVYYVASKTPIVKSNLKYVEIWDQVNSAYVTDGIKVYTLDGSSLQEPEYKLDAKTFGMLPHSDFFYDKNGVYKRQNKGRKTTLDKFPFKYKEPVTEDNTFITDDSHYIVYCNQAYDPWNDKFYKNLNELQIQNLKNRNFLSEDEDPKYTEIETVDIGYYYMKEGNKIFMFRELLPEIQDVNTFVPLSFTYSKDKNNVYYLVDEGYPHSKRRYKIKPILGADPLTFVLNVLPYDKDYVYIGDEKLISSTDIEFLAIFSGYRRFCGMDTSPSTNYILMRNNEGFWLLNTFYSLNKKIDIQYLGKVFNPRWNQVFENFELYAK